MNPVERRQCRTPRVLDWASGLPAAVAVRLFGSTGATLLRVQDGGHQTFDRLHPALPLWYRDAELVDPDDVDTALSTVDVCLLGGEDHPDGPRRAPVDAEQLRAEHPYLVVVDMTAYVPGEQDTTPAVDLLVQARTGFAFEQFDDRPTHFAFAPTLYGTGMLAVLGAWAALLRRLRTGDGDLVRVSMQQALALFWPHQWLTADRPDAAFDAVPPRHVRHLIFRCADGGHLQLVLGVPRALAKLHRVLGLPAPADPADRGAPDPSRGPRDYFADHDVLAPAVRRWRRHELVRALKAEGLAAEPVLAPGECFADPQVLAAGLVEQDERGTRHAGPPITLTSHPSGTGHPNGGPAAGGTGGDAGPLAGISVVDLGNWVAGPFASKLLADLGADVVSVDPPTGLSNLTGVRNTLASNRGKRSIVLDVKTPEGNAVLRRLVASADVVTHNLRTGAAQRLGVAPADLRTVRPDLVYLHTTAYGQTGPQAADSGFDMVMQAKCGHEVRAGGEGNEPLWYRAPFVDYAAGALGAIGVLAGLYERTTTGRAVDVHTSLLAAAMFIRGEYVVDAGGRAHGSSCLDADRLGTTPAESLYRTADGWIALAARGPWMYADLLGALHVDEAGALRPAVARLRTTEVLTRLAAAGVWATRCVDGALSRLLDDEAAWRANLVIATEDPRFGMVTGCYGPLLGFDSWTPDPAAFRPAPRAGEHGEEILARVGATSHDILIQTGGTGVSDYETIEFTVDGRLAYLKLNRPNRLNALNDALEAEIRAALLEFDLDDRLWVLIIHGSGTSFCAGLDVQEHSSFAFGSDQETRAARALEAVRAGHVGGAQHLRGTGGEGWLGRTANYKPVIAAVHGYALGGGAHLAAECDLIVASEDARFAISEITAGMSGSRTWAKIKTFMPSKIASEMLITGRKIEAAELYRVGLINRLVPDGQHVKAAEELAAEVLKAPPLATRDAVRVTRKQWVHLATQLDEQMQLSRLDLTEDFAEANRAFAEKRAPEFKAR